MNEKKNKVKVIRMNEAFIISQESSRNLEAGTLEGELVLDILNDLSAEEMQQGVKEQTIGIFTEELGNITFKFPPKYSQLIDRLIKEGLLDIIILSKSSSNRIIDLRSPE